MEKRASFTVRIFGLHVRILVYMRLHEELFAAGDIKLSVMSVAVHLPISPEQPQMKEAR